MRLPEKGVGNVKLFFALIFLAIVAFVAIKVIPVYVNNYELNDDIRQLAIQATVDRSSAEGVQNKVLEYAKGLGLPIKRENVTVRVGNEVAIDIDYTVPIDLKVYMLQLHFTPSAANKQL
jgi:YbbR domain-containing protein